MKTSAFALLGVASLAHTVQSQCTTTCLPGLRGDQEAFTCDQILRQWEEGEADGAWSNSIETMTCESLEEFNCCDCSGCLCNTTTTPPPTTSSTPEYDCSTCHRYLFGGNSTEDFSTGVDNNRGRYNQFFDATDDWTAFTEPHQRVEGCEAAALNGLDCSKCGCDCGDVPEHIDCEQEGPFCGECEGYCSGTQFIGMQECTYTIIREGSGFGKQCEPDFFQPCDGNCTTTTTEIATTTGPVTVTTTSAVTQESYDCSATYEVETAEGTFEYPLDVTTTLSNGQTVDLGGSCDSAAEYFYCEKIYEDFGADCYQDCNCVCENEGCNSRPFYPEASQWPSKDGQCFSRSRCVDPCTEFIGFPDLPGLNFTCQELLEQDGGRDLDDIQSLFDAVGENNYCFDFKCCTDYDLGGGIPVDVNGSALYTCGRPPTTTFATTPDNSTTSECDSVSIVVGIDGEEWTASQLIDDRGLSCYQIAFAIGGIFETDTGITGSEAIENFTFYPDFPPNVEALEIAHSCGCQDTCEAQSCEGCDNLYEALYDAGLDTSTYYCEDIKTDFNLDCDACGCPVPDDCDTKILFSSGVSSNTDTSLFDISCNQLAALGLNCYEIASYTALHGKEGACSDCDCSLTTETPVCDLPCGGGIFGGNSSSGHLGTDGLLSCNDFISAGLSCEDAELAGCTNCREYGCGCNSTAETTEDVFSCDDDCNDLYLSCNDLTEYFTCSDLEHSIFDGCNCGECNCVEEFTEMSCTSACMEGRSCDYWVETMMSDRYFYTCDNLESDYGCDCSGCACREPPTTLEPEIDCAVTTSCLEMDCATVSQMSGLSYYDLEELYDCDCTGCQGCNPSGCEGASCDDWQSIFTGSAHVSCEALEEQLDCDCSGCACATTTTKATTTGGCKETCSQLEGYYSSAALTCDELRAAEPTLSCAYMESFFECDCTGCLCDEVPDDVCDV